ncbi:hypothetical protein BUALT_Bualt15G0089000 [Buddleja alternifolia]|uniref:Uncharacterized protein n=1 Tax=Buddleja alternifolia TaxID=168488 RepID=A0AAV6WFK0_9LAMI|nr:hypothetical protein BUALT_Bualt15G0089000 [Buddleja alternifolia]
MKRKRGVGKRKPNKPSVPGANNVPVDPGYYSDVNEENNEVGSRKEIESGEVNTNVSSQHVGLDKPVTNKKIVGGGAAKLAWAISSTRTNRVPMHCEIIGPKEPKSSHLDPVYKNHDLDVAQSVIKNIMEMDAAVPFNAPVDPIALGIPVWSFTPIGHMHHNLQVLAESTMRHEGVGNMYSPASTMRHEEASHMYRPASTMRHADAEHMYCPASTMRHEDTEHMYRLASIIRHEDSEHMYRHASTMRHEDTEHIYRPASTMRHEDAEHMYPVGSTVNKSAYLGPHDWNQRQQLEPKATSTTSTLLQPYSA